MITLNLMYLNSNVIYDLILMIILHNYVIQLLQVTFLGKNIEPQVDSLILYS